MVESVTTSQREEVARRYVAEVFTGSNAERARDYSTADIAWHGGALGTVTAAILSQVGASALPWAG